jgi:hypothetical protein
MLNFICLIKSFWIFAVQKKSIIMKGFAIICLLILMSSCTSGSKNKESDFVEVKDSKIVNHQKDTNNVSVFNNDSIVGHWFQPHAAMINITFSKNGKFEFNTFDSKTMQDEKLTGIYSVEGQKVILKITNSERKEDFFEIKTNEGVSLFYDGEIGEGTILYTNEEMTELAPEGAHMLEDGRVVTLDANGSILSIATETPDIETETEEMAEPVMTDNTAIIEAVRPLFEEFRTIVADLSSRVDALENVETTEEESTETEDLSKVVAELTEKVETLSKMAGGESITKKNDSHKAEKSGLMLSKINELRNRKNK